MYIPRHNEEKRLPVLQALIAAQPLATLVTLGTSGLVASHIPMVLEKEGSEYGLLRGHVSRANPQWRDLVTTVDALAIFSGHQHYISPIWYAEGEDRCQEVPTWNYVAVHAYGPLKVIHDPHWLLVHVESLTTIHEAASEVPWKVSDAKESYIHSLLNGIVGFELPIERLEGKWKISQNRTQNERDGVIEGLSKLNTPESCAMKELVKKV
jgi:transcriptional regulator